MDWIVGLDCWDLVCCLRWRVEWVDFAKHGFPDPTLRMAMAFGGRRMIMQDIGRLRLEVSAGNEAPRPVEPREQDGLPSDQRCVLQQIYRLNYPIP